MMKKFIAILDYNMGNIKSVENAFLSFGANVIVTNKKKTIENASALILPGVGAFKDAMINLTELGLLDLIYDQVYKKPFLGICLGLQLLFEHSLEDGKNKGIGLLKGNVRRISPGVKIPHIGWNSIKIVKKDSSILKGISNMENFYFVHSFHAVCENEKDISSVTDYGTEIVSSIEKENIFGLQFHPEKSSICGLEILKNYWNITLERT